MVYRFKEGTDSGSYGLPRRSAFDEGGLNGFLDS
jgi:hypothetical protein